MEADVVVIGAGLAGLTCARVLAERGIPCRVLEGSDTVGGRATTDRMDGFLLDRGFQVLLTAYPQARRWLDFGELQVHAFEPGALIRYRGGFHRLADPWRRPGHALSTLFSPVATLADKLRIGKLRASVTRCGLAELYERPETTTREELLRRKFSSRIVESFFRPFLGGVFLDSELETSSRMFEFVFRMFAQGDAVLPADGMGAMARQLADGLPEGVVCTGQRVERLEGRRVAIAGGETCEPRAVVVAVAPPAAAELLGQTAEPMRSVTCLYFAADQPPVEEPILVLNGEGSGPVNNLCVPSQVVPSYAPPDKSLVSVTVLGIPAESDERLEREVRDQLSGWFGKEVERWRHLRTYRIEQALPRQVPPALSPVEKPSRHAEGVFVCGDYLDTASIQGAMASGERAAAAVHRYLQGG